jgi:hypothetical protein
MKHAIGFCRLPCPFGWIEEIEGGGGITKKEKKDECYFNEAVA